MSGRRHYSLLGEEMVVTIRYGWALLQFSDRDEVAVCVPILNRWRLELELVQWCNTYDDAFTLVSIMDAAGKTIDDWKEAHPRGRTTQETSAAQEPGGSGKELLQIAAEPFRDRRLAAALAVFRGWFQPPGGNPLGHGGT